MIYDGFPLFFGLGLQDGHVPTFWLASALAQALAKRVLSTTPFVALLSEIENDHQYHFETCFRYVIL